MNNISELRDKIRILCICHNDLTERYDAIKKCIELHKDKYPHHEISFVETNKYDKYMISALQYTDNENKTFIQVGMNNDNVVGQVEFVWNPKH